MSWLIITEKQSAASRIASLLFKDAKALKDGKIVYYYSKSNDAYVLGLKGHVVELDFPKKFRSWTKTKLVDLINSELVTVEKEKAIISLLRELAKKSQRVTIATDYDREGELIGLEAVEIIRAVKEDVKVDRARFSAITKEEIAKAFAKPEKLDLNLAKSALARQKIDLIWGAVLTRFISLSSRRLGKDFLSVGRVQTPTLRLIVEREKEIENFKPEKYYEISLDLGFIAKHPKRFKDLSSAKEAISKIGEFALVKNFEVKKRVEPKPTPFNTTEFLREASAFMPPHVAMSVAENLYINGYISYPRTDNTVYPESLDLLRIVEAFKDSEFSKEAKKVLEQETIVPSKGKRRTTDHPPIHPTSVAKRGELTKEEWIIYELIVRRFLATLAKDAIWEMRRAELESGIEFIAIGKKLVEPGWREIYVYSKAEEVALPMLSVGEKLRIIDKRLEEKETRPPPRFSSASLIKLMEKLNLGTKSTRHEILKKLVSRGYVAGNPYRPTQIAFSVIDVLREKAETITLPEMTAKLEKEMDEIAEGKKSEEEVVLESRKLLEEIMSEIKIEEISEKLREGVKKDKVIGKCPQCGKELVLRRSKAKKRFIGCSGYPECNFSLPLPQKGSLTVTAKECEKHRTKILRVRDKKTWSFCPICNAKDL
ncbi:MAG: DNA topoisomerase I [Archaeoglobaceae archaeon]